MSLLSNTICVKALETGTPPVGISGEEAWGGALKPLFLVIFSASRLLFMQQDQFPSQW